MHKITTAAVAGALLVPAATSSALAGSNDTTGIIATWDGTTINLADGWQGAHACLVLTTTDVKCYDTQAELRDALTATATKVGTHALSSTCAAAGELVTLYASTGFSGNSLSFATTNGQWRNLSQYGFDNQMESWVNQTACNALVADGTGGTGDRLTLTARSSSSNVGSTWKDRASSIDVAA